ncbi:MAG: hypothetical protein V8Q84_01230 [Bilophila sp.]
MSSSCLSLRSVMSRRMQDVDRAAVLAVDEAAPSSSAQMSVPSALRRRYSTS